MCHMYEKVTGKKSKGDVSMLRGMLKEHLDAKSKIVIIRIPVEMLEIDTRYQTDVRTVICIILHLIGMNGNYFLLLVYLTWKKEKYTLLMDTVDGLQVRL